MTAECRGRLDTIPAQYSRGPVSHRALSLAKMTVFLWSSLDLPGVCQYNTSLDHDHSLPHTFQFVSAHAFRRYDLTIHSSHGASA
jgi:hypothetical protein